MRLFLKCFVFLLIASSLSAVALANSNQVWIGDGTSQGFGDPANWSSDTSSPPADGDWLHINSGTDSTCPIISLGANGLYPAPMNDILVGENWDTVSGAGLLKQDGCTQDLYYALRIGSSALTGNPVSKFIMTSSTLNKLNGGGDFEIGVNGGYGELSMTNSSLVTNGNYYELRVGGTDGHGTLTMSSSTIDVEGSCKIGSNWGGYGKLDMNNSTINIGHVVTDNPDYNREFAVGSWNGATTGDAILAGSSLIKNFTNGKISIGEGNGAGDVSLTMSETSKIEGKGFLRIGSYGENGKNTTVLMSGTSSIVVDGERDESQLGQGNGTHLDLTLQNNAKVQIGGGYNLNIGSYWGSATVDLSGTSKFISQTTGEVRLGLLNAGVTTVKVSGSATFETHSLLRAADEGGDSLEVELSQNATFDSDGETRFAYASGVAKLTASGTSTFRTHGVLDAGRYNNASVTVELTDNAKIDALAFTRFGCDGGTADITLGLAQGSDTASIVLSDRVDTGCWGGVATWNMYANTHVDVTGKAAIGGGDDSNSRGTVNIHDSAKFSSTTEIAIGDGNGARGVVNMTGGSLTAPTGIWVGNADGSYGELNMSGNSTVSTVGELQIGWAGTGTAQIGGALTDNALVAVNTLQLGGTNGAYGKIDLKVGGTIETTKIYSAANPAESILNLDGGTLKATASDSPADRFVNDNGNAALFEINVKAGGAKIDTNGNDVSIAEPLLHAAAIDGGLTKLGAGKLALVGINTYTGDTTVSEGAFELVSSGLLAVDINDPAEDFTQILGVGTALLDGTLQLDVADVTVTTGSWAIVDVAGLNETFGSTFGMALATGGSFSKAGGVLTYVDGLRTWKFTEATGTLSLAPVPEPGTLALLAAGLLGLVAFAWRKQK